MEYNNLNWNIFSGYRYSKVSSEEEMAQQLLFGGSYGFFDQRLKLSATHEQTISDKESTLFPTKTTLGLNYALNSSIDFFSAYEWTDEVEQGRAGVRVRPWSGMTLENTTLSEFKNDNKNIYNTLGGLQSFQINDKWAVNVGYEKGEIVRGTAESNSSLGDKSFSAYRLGVNYHEEAYSATLNGEVREGDNLDKLNISSAVYTQNSDELAIALSATFNRETGTEHENRDSNIRVSFAYRPEEDGKIILDKLDFISSKMQDEVGEFRTEKMINNLNVNLLPTDRSELSLQHGFKYVIDTVNDFEYKGVTQLFGLDARYDLTKSWEIGVQGSMLYAQSANNMDYGLGIYSGHNLFDNMVLTLGYNWEGFEDQDFSLQTYRMEGVYFRFNMKFDQESLKDTVRLMSW
jgi:opacity protein-like surface antigen